MMAFKQESSVYEIRHIPSNRRYIGSSVNTNYRWWRHRKDLNLGRHHCSHLQNAWNKYGESSFEFSILEIVKNKQHLVAVEQVFIDYYKNIVELFNGCYVAGSCLGYKHSAESSDKKRAASIGRIVSISTREKISNSHKGKTYSAETLLKMSEAAHKRKASEATRMAMSLSLKGKRNTKSYKPIIRVDILTGDEKCYDSTCAAAIDGFNSAGINQVIAGIRVQYKGYFWKHAKEEDSIEDNKRRATTKRVDLRSRARHLRPGELFVCTDCGSNNPKDRSLGKCKICYAAYSYARNKLKISRI